MGNISGDFMNREHILVIDKNGRRCVIRSSVPACTNVSFRFSGKSNRVENLEEHLGNNYSDRD